MVSLGHNELISQDLVDQASGNFIVQKASNAEKTFIEFYHKKICHYILQGHLMNIKASQITHNSIVWWSVCLD